MLDWRDSGYCSQHPDRAASGKCQQCGRPNCADCNRAGLCIECSRNALRAHGELHRLLSARVAEGRIGPLSAALIVVYVGLYLLVELTETDWSDGSVTPWLVQAPWNFHYSIGYDTSIFVVGVEDGAVWRFVSSGLLHFGITTVLLSVLATYHLGPRVERLLGRRGFAGMLAVALLSGVAADYVLSGYAYSAAIGAPTAGLAGCAAVLQLLHGQRARSAVLTIAALLTLAGFGIDRMDWLGPLGGLLGGLVYGVAAVLAPLHRRYVLAVFCGAILALIAIRTTTVIAEPVTVVL